MLFLEVANEFEAPLSFLNAVLFLAASALTAQSQSQSIDLPSSKQLIGEIPGHPQRLNSEPISMAVSPDGRYVVTVNATTEPSSRNTCSHLPCSIPKPAHSLIFPTTVPPQDQAGRPSIPDSLSVATAITSTPAWTPSPIHSVASKATLAVASLSTPSATAKSLPSA